MNKGKKLRKYSFTEVLAIVLMGMIFLFVFLQVVSRFVFNSPIVWAEEMARLTLIWITFISAAVIALKSEHVAFDILQKSLAPKVQIAVNCILYLAYIAFFLLSSFYGVKMMIAGHKIPSVSLDFVRWSYVYAALPIGFMAIAVVYVRKLIALFRPNQADK